MEITCIVCPVGCLIKTEKNDNDNSLIITGNNCPRGEEYAREEILSPKRMVTATCTIASNIQAEHSLRRIPVKSSKACPKELIKELLTDIYKIKIKVPVKAGYKAIKNWKNTGIDIVVVRSL